MNKTRYLLLLFLNFIYSCKSTTNASDASVTAAFVITIIIFLVILIVGIHAHFEDELKINKINSSYFQASLNTFKNNGGIVTTES